MSVTEPTPPNPPTPTPPNPPAAADPAALAAEVARLRAKNEELVGEKRKLSSRLADLPDDVDPRQLWADHQAAQTQRLEAEGNYTQARQQLEQQYRDSEARLKARIEELEAEVRQLKVLGPAAAALAEHVHDPGVVLQLNLKPDQLSTEPDGAVVVVDGYNRTPVAEWARATLPQWMLKAPKPAGTGAPPGGSNAGGSDGALAAGSNPWLSGNITQQCELANRDPDLAMRLANAAGKKLVIRTRRA